MRRRINLVVNRVAAIFGLRIVNADWGPRGFAASFRAAKRKGLSPGTIIDIGASTGVWTRECLQVFPEAQYFLIDPLPTNEAALRELGKRHWNVDWWSGAVGASEGRLNIHVHGDQSSVLESTDFHGDLISVEERTLDSLLAEKRFATPLIIKADVQGFELEVLRGATQCLESCEVLLLELSVQRLYQNSCLAHEVIAYLGQRGFHVFDIASYVQRPQDSLLAQMDVVFVSADSKLATSVGWK